MNKLEIAFKERDKKRNKIEKLKELKTPMSVFDELENICSSGYENLKDEDSKYFLKCFGIFDKGDETFMIRVRIPAGQLNIIQAKIIGDVAKSYGDDYIDITTRQQIELRYIKFENLAKVLKELNSVGISTFQTGVDNFRNIVTSSFDGLSEDSFIECKPIIDELQNIFINREDWIGELPRKFNTALIGCSTNDCNIYGHDCSFIIAKRDNEIGFNLYLGGKVGVQAVDSGLFIKKNEVISVYKAIINLFKTYGFRDNRNKNRLYFLIQAVGIDEFVKAIKEYSQLNLQNSGKILVNKESIIKAGAVKLNNNLNALQFSIPSGIFSGSDLIEVSKLADINDSEIRLSVEQNIYLINNNIENLLKDSEIYKKYSKFNNIYFHNQIACAGTATCSFGVIANKPDAIELSEYLNREVSIENGKIRLYWSACPKGCGIHSIGDIGFEGCKAKDEDGNRCDGVHIYLGGKATIKSEEARVIFKFTPLTKAKKIVKKLVEFYRDEKNNSETFEEFDTRLLSKLSIQEIQERVK